MDNTDPVEESAVSATNYDYCMNQLVQCAPHTSPVLQCPRGLEEEGDYGGCLFIIYVGQTDNNFPKTKKKKKKLHFLHKFNSTK